MRAGTRKSALAHKQVKMLEDLLKEPVEMVDITSEGDSRRDISLDQFDTQGIFVNSLNKKVLDGEVDFAVHSAKDLPSEIDSDLKIAALFDWEHFHDILIGKNISGAKIGTSSLRRIAQSSFYGKNWKINGIRGNIDTRISKVNSGEFDGILLSEAGVRRLFPQLKFEILPHDVFVPAATQGIIAVVARKDSNLLGKLKRVEANESRKRWDFERTVAMEMGIGCTSATGIFYHPIEGTIFVFHEAWGKTPVRKFKVSTPAEAARKVLGD